MIVLIPDEESLVLLIKKIFWLVQDAAGYHQGPVQWRQLELMQDDYLELMEPLDQSSVHNLASNGSY